MESQLQGEDEDGSKGPPQKGQKRVKSDDSPGSSSSVGSLASRLTVSVFRRNGATRPSTTFCDLATVALITFNVAFASLAMHPREISSGAYNYYYHFLIMQTLFVLAGAYNECYHTKSPRRHEIIKMFKDLIIVLHSLKLTHLEVTVLESLMETFYDHEGGISTSTAHILPNTPGFCPLAANYEKLNDCASFYLISPSVLVSWLVYQVRMNNPNGEAPPNMPDNFNNNPFKRSAGPTVLTKLMATTNRAQFSNERVFPQRQAVSVGPFANFSDRWSNYYSSTAQPGYLHTIAQAINIRNCFHESQQIFSQHTVGSFFTKGRHSTGRTNGALAMMHRMHDFDAVVGTMNHPTEEIFRCEWTAVSPIVLSQDSIDVSCLFTLNPFFRYINPMGPTKNIGSVKVCKTTGAERSDDRFQTLQVPDYDGFMMHGPMYQLQNIGTTAHYHRELAPTIYA